MRRYVIVGTGAAGIAAAEAIRSSDASANIHLLGEEPFGYYSRPGLAYYLTGELNERQLYPFSNEDFRRLGFRPQHVKVLRINPKEHKIMLKDGTYFPYDRLLIATGSEAARGNVVGEDLKGVVKLDNLEDAREILSLTRKRPSAVVVGGGITALEIVEGLLAHGVKTHYFLRRDRYWHNVLDETESRIVEDRLREHGVCIHYNTELAEILGRNGWVNGVRTQDGKQIACQLVAIAVGVLPRKELGVECGLEADRGLLVDEYLQTSNVIGAISLGGIPAASELFGHSLGIAGFLLMLMTETLYTLRKRSRSARWGRVSFWLQFHIFTGLVGSYMVLLHSSWKFHGLAGLVMLLTTVVVFSGFIGRYIYTAIPRTADGIQLEVGEIQRQIGLIEADIQRWLEKQPQLAQHLPVEMVALSSLTTGGSLLSLRNPWAMWSYRVNLWLLRRKMDPRTRKQIAHLGELLRRRQTMHRQQATLAQARRLLALWHALHVPLGLVLFTAAFIHIGAAIYYATLLK